MVRFSDSFLDEIRQRLPIHEVVGEQVIWDKRKSQPGRGDYWACCPFHGEKSPSFHADDRKGIYHCFGCGVTGDHFRFLTEKAGMSFPEAVEKLAGMAGVPMPARDEREEAREEVRRNLYDVMEVAAKYFEAALAHNIGARARGYLFERGVSAAAQTRFRIGFAPDSRNGLKEHLAANGVSAQEMVDTGLVASREDDPLTYDRFRNRVMFPITDFRGRIIGFGGRALTPDVPAKYLNSPETPLFQKRLVLYNGMDARKAARDGKPVIVVEGYLDVIASVMAGFEGTVAPMGTAMTEDHLQMLWRMNDAPILCFDGDSAGIRAAERAANLVLPLLQPGQDCQNRDLAGRARSGRSDQAGGAQCVRRRAGPGGIAERHGLEHGDRRHRSGDARGPCGAGGAVARKGQLDRRPVGAAALYAGLRRAAGGVLSAGAAGIAVRWPAR